MAKSHGGMSSLGAIERSEHGDQLYCDTEDCSEEGAAEFCCYPIECDPIPNCLGDTKCTSPLTHTHHAALTHTTLLTLSASSPSLGCSLGVGRPLIRPIHPRETRRLSHAVYSMTRISIHPHAHHT